MTRNLSQVRILSIDGGGVRGVLPAYWLTKLEQQIKNQCNGQTILQTFDWFAGTSTGAIIAAGLACGISTKKIWKLYQRDAKTIFPTFWGGRVLNPFRWSGALLPKHSDAGLNRVLCREFKEKRFRDIPDNKRLIIVSFSAGHQEPVIFDSHDERFDAIKIWEACRASAAAPTYLPEAEFPLYDLDKMSFLDGGVVANDPAAIAFAKALGMRRDKECALVVSMGTGQSGSGFNPQRAFKFSGLLPWASSLTTTLMDASTGGHESIILDLLDEQHYFRFDTNLSLAKPTLDDASKKQLLALEHDASKYWNKEETKHKWQALLRQLTCGPPLDLTALKGEWRSVFTWTDQDGNEVTEQEEFIDIEVLGNGFLKGTTKPGSKHPGSFEASQVGARSNLVGTWYNTSRSLASTFILNQVSDNELRGPWIGCGDKDANQYQGQWILTREPVAPEAHPARRSEPSRASE